MAAYLAAMRSPVLYTGAMVGTLALALVPATRNGGWWPVFRQLRIRRVLLLALLLSCIAVLSNPAPAQPVAYRWDQPDSARVLGAKTPAAAVLASFPAPQLHRRRLGCPTGGTHQRSAHAPPSRGPDPYGQQGAAES